MSRAESWNSLVDALSAETTLVEELVRRAMEMSGALSCLEVTEVERHSTAQEITLRALSEAAHTRAAAIDRCVPGRGEFHGRLALQLVIESAPEPEADRLRGLQGRLVGLRDEFLLVRERNQFLIEQTLEFTAHFSASLADAAADPPSYDASGSQAKLAPRGDLFVGAL